MKYHMDYCQEHPEVRFGRQLLEAICDCRTSQEVLEEYLTSC